MASTLTWGDVNGRDERGRFASKKLGSAHTVQASGLQYKTSYMEMGDSVKGYKPVRYRVPLPAGRLNGFNNANAFRATYSGSVWPPEPEVSHQTKAKLETTTKWSSIVTPKFADNTPGSQAQTERVAAFYSDRIEDTRAYKDVVFFMSQAPEPRTKPPSRLVTM